MDRHAYSLLVGIEQREIDFLCGERGLELSSVICLIGVLRAIEAGLIRPGESVLVTLTGGFAQSRQEEFMPAHRVEKTGDTASLWRLLDEIVR